MSDFFYQISKSLKRTYKIVSIFLSIILIASTAYHLKDIILKDAGIRNIRFEQILIALTIIFIPIVLKYFARKTKEINLATEDIKSRLLLYKKIFLIRLYSIGGLSFINILLFSIYGNTNFFWLSIVCVATIIFCKLNIPEMESITKESEPIKRMEYEKNDEPN